MIVSGCKYKAIVFYATMNVQQNKFLYNKTDQMQQFPKFTLA